MEPHRIIGHCPMIRFDEGSLIVIEQIQIAIKRHRTVIDKLFIGERSSLSILGVKQVACGQIKSCSGKPLLLRHFHLSFNQLLLARTFYSPIVAPNVKFGFVLCALHRWSTDASMSNEMIIDRYLSRTDVSLRCSSDELSILFNEIRRGKIEVPSTKKISADETKMLQRWCRFLSLFGANSLSKQRQKVEQQFLTNYRTRLAMILHSHFSKTISKLSPTEWLIYSVCAEKDSSQVKTSSSLCPLCNASISMTNADLLVCSCLNKHSWPRCPRTLLPLVIECSQTCSLCDRSISTIDLSDKTFANFLKLKDKDLTFSFSTICTYCL